MIKYKAKIKITLRHGILDVQGKTVEHALHSIEFPMMTGVRIGKYVELDIEANDKEEAYKLVSIACNRLIANPIIEDFAIEIVNSQ